MIRPIPRIVAALALFACSLTASADSPTPAGGARSPNDELATFKVVPGFTVQLVASEPEVIDPVAMCFDERGRIFVCEMRGYPNGGVGTGNESRGRIKLLTDTNGDGVYETSVIFAEGLRFPMGVTPWKNGIIVAVAPDIVYLEDTNDDGKADKSTVLYTGFNLANIQQMVNNPQWGLDNWIYGIGGSNAGTITSPQKPDMPPITLQSRGFRFHPDRPGSFETTSGGGQYGITPDEFGHWFTATNSQHLRQIVLPDRYLRRNPNAPITAVTTDIPDHGASAKVFRISPFEGWRVERTTRRVGSELGKRLPATELVPGGFTSSSCGGVVYTADRFPSAFRGNYFVCDPGNNMIHRDVLEPNGAIFTGRRGDADCEFLASTDNWFRPVSLTLGPDGTLYLLDFYREVIETPLSLPDDIKAKLNLESRERGRIWRIAPTGFQPSKLPDLSKLTPTQLTEKLADPNSSVRLTAQRLLVERGAKTMAPTIAELAKANRGKSVLPNLLFMLREFDALPDAFIASAMNDPLPGNREVGLRLAEPRFEASEALRTLTVKLANDPVSMVRFQAALTASFLPPADAEKVLAAVIRQDASDPWTQSAVLLAARNGIADLLTAILRNPPAEVSPSLRAFVTKAATMVGTKGDDTELSRVFETQGKSLRLDFAVIEGIGAGTKGRGKSLPTTPVLKAAWEKAIGLVESESADPSDRLAAIRILAFAPLPGVAKPLANVLVPQSSPEVQLAAVRALAAHSDAEVSAVLLKAWSQLGPSVRREVQEQLLASPTRVTAFLDAIEKGTVRPAEIEPARIVQMKGHPNASIRERSTKLFASVGGADRKKILVEYQPALALTGDAIRGKAVFLKQCAACHKIGTDGHEVGPNLLAAVPGKSGEDLLAALFDPNREVDSRYLNYLAATIDGRVLTGILSADTPASVTLRRSDGSEDTIRRSELESLKSTGLSLMPEGLEKNVSKQDIADLLAFLRQTVIGQKK